MKTRIGLIPIERISEAQELSVNLQSAMEAGEMKAVDQAAEELLSLTNKEYSITLSEEYWHQLIKQVRSFNENFKSDYIMEMSQLEMIIAAGTAESFADVVRVVEQALKTESVVLQLPFEGEDDDV